MDSILLRKFSSFQQPSQKLQQPCNLDNIHIALIQAKQAIADAQTWQARNANRSLCDISFQIGDQVLLSTSNLRNVTGL